MDFRLLALLSIITACSACSGSTANPASAAVTAAAPFPRVPVPDPSLSTCPAKDFEGFLKRFAADAKTRERFTADTVVVTDWKDVDEPTSGMQVIPVPRSRYKDFSPIYRAGGFHHVARDGDVQSAVESPRIVASGDGYDVSYIYGMSEGNSWHFSRGDVCWLLIADPEPSLL